MTRGLADAALARADADHVLDGGERALGQAALAAEALLEALLLLVATARRSRPFTVSHAVERVDALDHGLLEVRPDRAAGRGERHDHVHASLSRAARSSGPSRASTMSLRSSGSMTLRRASRICSSVGIASDCRRRFAHAPQRPTAPRRAPSAEGGEILHCRRYCRQPHPGAGLSSRPGGSGFGGVPGRPGATSLARRSRPRAGRGPRPDARPRGGWSSPDARRPCARP